jgi:hypothetical protein
VITISGEKKERKGGEKDYYRLNAWLFHQNLLFRETQTISEGSFETVSSRGCRKPKAALQKTKKIALNNSRQEGRRNHPSCV